MLQFFFQLDVSNFFDHHRPSSVHLRSPLQVAPSPFTITFRRTFIFVHLWYSLSLFKFRKLGMSFVQRGDVMDQVLGFLSIVFFDLFSKIFFCPFFTIGFWMMGFSYLQSTFFTNNSFLEQWKDFVLMKRYGFCLFLLIYLFFLQKDGFCMG